MLPEPAREGKQGSGNVRCGPCRHSAWSGMALCAARDGQRAGDIFCRLCRPQGKARMSGGPVSSAAGLMSGGRAIRRSPPPQAGWVPSVAAAPPPSASPSGGPASYQSSAAAGHTERRHQQLPDIQTDVISSCRTDGETSSAAVSHTERRHQQR